MFAHDMMVKAMDHGGHLCVMASEEEEDIIHIPPMFNIGKYVLLFDPLDGSSNIRITSYNVCYTKLLRNRSGRYECYPASDCFCFFNGCQ